MANTIMSAKNSFQDGLLLDFSPENSKATSMTAALNATLITFNGNEMSLQNDMGNGRVETAFLPEGYIPVGSCEFGDIIYIVSYNPLINKSQIGCFPSPERNISSEELEGLQQSLSWKDFQEGNDTSGPTGELKASSVKKILYSNRDMTPGDKYIIYSTDLKQTSNNQYLSDYGNKVHEHGKFPKLVKFHVVSVEESGKIVYLDSTTKWYDNNYYLNSDLEVNGQIKDLDSYRTMVSSAYSIFSSKVSGKLALLIELEKITGFSCSWEPYVNEEATTNTHTEYDIYWNFNWTTDDNNINPDGAILLTSEWTGVDKNREGQYQEWVVDGQKIKLDTSWKQIDSCPIAYNNNNYQYWSFSRQYKPENTIDFDDFFNIYEYNKYLQTTITILTQNGELPIPYKLNINRNKGIPQISNYFVNCTSVIKDKYYTQNINGKVVTIDPVTLNDDIVNNYFHYPVIKKFASFNIPTKQFLTVDGKKIEKTPNISNLIYHYKVAPTMPYGILREFTQEGYIDFSKIGTKSIALNSWKYYNYENTSTLTWGMEAYTEPGKGISEVVFEFYDNQGFVAAYHTKGKNSYNGVFTEYITLNESGSNYKLNNIPAFSTEPKYHKGLEILGSDAVEGGVYLDANGNKVQGILDKDTKYWQDDSGTLYSNLLYLVKIVIKYCNKGILDEYIEPTDEADSNHVIIDYRWYWTNSMFNEYYYQTKDFKDLQFTLDLDSNAHIATTANYELKKYEYKAPFSNSTGINNSNSYQSLSANIQAVNIDGTQNNNIKLAITPGLYQTYNTFNLSDKGIDALRVSIFLAKDYLDNSPVQPNVIFTEDEILMDNSMLYPVLETKCTGQLNKETSKTLNTLVGSSVTGEGKEIYADSNAYVNYKNNFKLTSTETQSNVGNGEDSSGNKTLTYLTSQGKEETITNFQQYNKKISDIIYNDEFSKYFNLTLSGIHYSKYMYLTKKLENVMQLKSFVLNTNDLTDYQLISDGQNIYFSHILVTSNTDESGHNCHQHLAVLTLEKRSGYYYKKGVNQFETYNLGDDGDIDVHKALELNYDEISQYFNFLFPFGYGHNGRNSSPARKENNDPIISNNVDFNRTTSYYALDLGGTLAGITEDSIEPANQHVNKNTLEHFTPQVLGILTQLFYLTDSQKSLQMPFNYIYLDNNYLSYKKDIVLYSYAEKASNTFNNLILISGIYYQEYINEVCKKVFGNTSTELLTSPNVNLIINGCTKTQPVEFQFNYITPIAEAPTSNSVLVTSIFNDIPSTVNQGFQRDTIYGWDSYSKSFKELGGIDKLRKINSYTISGTNITSSIENNSTNVYLKDINKYRLLNINGDNKLRLSKFPSSTNTYSVNTHSKKSGQGKNRSLTGYKNFVFFSDN